jgi:hypothetical protein
MNFRPLTAALLVLAGSVSAAHARDNGTGMNKRIECNDAPTPYQFCTCATKSVQYDADLVTGRVADDTADLKNAAAKAPPPGGDMAAYYSKLSSAASHGYSESEGELYLYRNFVLFKDDPRHNVCDQYCGEWRQGLEERDAKAHNRASQAALVEKTRVQCRNIVEHAVNMLKDASSVFQQARDQYDSQARAITTATYDKALHSATPAKAK